MTYDPQQWRDYDPTTPVSGPRMAYAEAGIKGAHDAIAGHQASQDPHIQYLTQARGDARYPGKGDLVVNVRDYGAKGDGSTDDTAAIQAGINAVGAAGGGTLLFPANTYITGTLALRAGVMLTGVGIRTVLKHKGGNGHLITLADTLVDFAGVRNMLLNCVNQWANNNCIHFVNDASAKTSQGYADSHLLLENLLIREFPGHGVYFSTNVREARVVNVVVRYGQSNGGHGFHIAGTDNFFALCTATQTRGGGHGYYVNGSNNRFVGCKAFFCGTAGDGSDGWVIDRGRNTLSACEAQDNGGNGFRFVGNAANGAPNDCTGTGLVADSNGGAGFMVDDPENVISSITLEGFTSVSRSGDGRYTQTAGIKFIGTGSGSGGNYIGSSRGNTADIVGNQPIGSLMSINGQLKTGAATVGAKYGDGLGVNTVNNANNGLTVTPGGDAKRGLVVYGNSATQSGDLAKFQTSAFADVLRIDPTGRLFLASAAAPGTPTDGSWVYVEGGVLKVKGTSGTVFTTAQQAAVASPAADVVALKTAVDALRAVLQASGLLAP